MSQNKLILNNSKTHLIILATRNQHRQNGNYRITLDTGAEEKIEPISCEKLLGGYISNDFKWNEHIRGSDGSIFKSVTSRINALKRISFFSTFKNRKMIANGIIMSRFVYLIQLWGGCPEYLLNFLQILQNKAARLVCNKDRYTPVTVLLSSCGWLSIRQLVAYHRVLLLFKIKCEGKPKYFEHKFSSDQNPAYKTRFQEDGRIRKPRIYKKDESKTSFVPDSIDVWNRLPVTIRKSETLKKFKERVKSWISVNIEI